MLFVVALYERRRANEIESRSMVAASHRAIVEQELEVMKRELAICLAYSKFDREHARLVGDEGDSFQLSTVSFRNETANIRNSQFKLARERSRLNAMKRDVVGDMAQSSLVGAKK
jgi:hypothetical protein